MTMTTDLLERMWKIEEISACDDGMAMAYDFLKSCVSALESGQSANLNARFESYVRHRAECEKCNGV
jgi:hypothetical protein